MLLLRRTAQRAVPTMRTRVKLCGAFFLHFFYSLVGHKQVRGAKPKGRSLRGKPRSRWSAGGWGASNTLTAAGPANTIRPRFCALQPASLFVLGGGETFFQPVSPGRWPKAQPTIRVAARRLAQYNLSELSGWKTSAPNLPNGPERAGPGTVTGRAPFSKRGFMLAGFGGWDKCCAVGLGHCPAQGLGRGSAGLPFPQVDQELPGKGHQRLFAPPRVDLRI